MDRSSLRGLMEESKPSIYATQVIIEVGKEDDVDDNVDDPDLVP